MAEFTAIAGESRPPIYPTLLAWLSTLAAGALLARYPATDPPEVHLTGWLLGGVGTVICLGWFRLLDQRRRQRPNYSRHRYSGAGLYLAVAAGVVFGALHALKVAQWYYG
jgi:hypothetical protein